MKQARQRRAVEQVRKRINFWTNVMLGNKKDPRASFPGMPSAEDKLETAQRELANLKAKGFN